ncbi:SGNH/GDSL hydrolase family protein [Croceibacterium mercuriale]|uniref:SGNH/GDSL hydrolase family protein n=1 Tax=Croceibacterium mercuriale TaxID=1572751 RepID=UPI00068F242A|nr:SGNH/GDSL hydrolase family protein [Croceibacterium mercuriale]
MKVGRAFAGGVLLWLALPAAAQQDTAETHWIAGWTQPMMAAAEAGSAPPADSTVRVQVLVTATGPRIRLRFSNAFGTEPLLLQQVRVAHATQPGQDLVDPASTQAVAFGGSAWVIIPPGAEYLSDPVALPATAGGTVAVTFHLPQASASVGSVPQGISFVAPGAVGGDPASLPGGASSNRLPVLTGVHVAADRCARTIAAIGNSITAHGGGTVTGADRWTEVLATRLRADAGTSGWSVVNLGISGGRVAKAGTGQAATARFERDVLSQPGLATIVVFEGVNDVGKLVREEPVTPESRARTVASVIEGYRQMIARAHDAGVRIVGMTILPFRDTPTYRSDAAAEEDRQALNRWIRQPGHFDAVIDLDPAMTDPVRPGYLLPAVDRGDGLHPSPAGQAVLGAAIPLEALSAPMAGCP